MKAKSKKQLKKKAWEYFSLYIRLKDSDQHGWSMCCTCGVKRYFKDLQAGHFVAGRNNSILFDEKNCHAQCCGCNMFKGGNVLEYFFFMEKKYGRAVIEDLIMKSKQPLKRTNEDYLELIDKYKSLVEQLKNEKDLI